MHFQAYSRSVLLVADLLTNFCITTPVPAFLDQQQTSFYINKPDPAFPGLHQTSSSGCRLAPASPRSRPVLAPQHADTPRLVIASTPEADQSLMATQTASWFASRPFTISLLSICLIKAWYFELNLSSLSSLLCCQSLYLQNFVGSTYLLTCNNITDIIM